MTRPPPEVLERERDALLSALVSMCDQYLGGPDDEWDDMFMSAGEEATQLLCELGYATWLRGSITRPDREALERGL